MAKVSFIWQETIQDYIFDQLFYLFTWLESFDKISHWSFYVQRFMRPLSYKHASADLSFAIGSKHLHTCAALLQVGISNVVSWISFVVSQRCQHSYHGAAGYGLCPEDVLCQEHHWSHSLLSLQQAMQDEEERIYCLQAASIHVSKSWYELSLLSGLYCK